MTSRFVNGRSAAELPISRQSSTHATAAFRSSGWDSVLASICIGSSGLRPVKRLASAFRAYDTSIQRPGSRGWIELSACLDAAQRTLHLAGLETGVSRRGLLFQKNVASAPLLRGA